MANRKKIKEEGGDAKAKALAKEVFADTSGFFALLCTRDPAHVEAKRRMAAYAKTGQRLVTTDGVLDETFSLLKARGLRHLGAAFWQMVNTSKSLRVEWTQPARFVLGVEFFLKQIDQGYSLTDCVSFLVMGELGLADALTTDHHFQIAGFRALLLKPS